MSVTFNEHIDKIKQLTKEAAQAVVNDDIAQCNALLVQRQELLSFLDGKVQIRASEDKSAQEVQDYIAVLQWILTFDENAIKLLKDSKQNTLDKSSQQSKNKYALKQYQANYR